MSDQKNKEESFDIGDFVRWTGSTGVHYGLIVDTKIALVAKCASLVSEQQALVKWVGIPLETNRWYPSSFLAKE